MIPWFDLRTKNDWPANRPMAIVVPLSAEASDACPARRAVIFGLCAALLGGTQSAADDPFYKGKRLSLIINFAAGGPTDIEGRRLAKHLARHIDGHPSILVHTPPRYYAKITSYWM